MFLTMAILLGLVAAFVELRTSFSVPFIRRAIEKASVLGIAFSVILSIILGTLFGAAGVVVLLGALIATSITQPVYMVMSRVKRSGQDFHHNVQEARDTFRPVWKALKFTILLLTSPIWVPIRIRRWWLNEVRSPEREVHA